MPVTAPLNVQLYAALQAEFGKVNVAHVGEKMLTSPAVDFAYRYVQRGETYCVNCPFCHDTRQRLWIPHHWGVPDDEGYMHWASAKCFNDPDCMSHIANRETLSHMIYAGVGRDRRREHILDGIVVPQITTTTLPGDPVRIDMMPPGHRAVQYLYERGIDPRYVGPAYGVSVVDGYYADWPAMTDRIIIPIYFDGQLVSWQARAPYDGAKQKYLNRKGCPKTRLLYNYDAARTRPFVVVVEGVTDVWALNDIAVSPFGCSISDYQIELLRNTWPLMFLMLDEEDKFDKAIGDIKMLEQRMTVIQVHLPTGADPAKIAAENAPLLWQILDGAAAAHGIDLLDLLRRAV